MIKTIQSKFKKHNIQFELLYIYKQKTQKTQISSYPWFSLPTTHLLKWKRYNLLLYFNDHYPILSNLV